MQADFPILILSTPIIFFVLQCNQERLMAEAEKEVDPDPAEHNYIIFKPPTKILNMLFDFCRLIIIDQTEISPDHSDCLLQRRSKKMNFLPFFFFLS